MLFLGNDYSYIQCIEINIKKVLFPQLIQIQINNYNTATGTSHKYTITEWLDFHTNTHEHGKLYTSLHLLDTQKFAFITKLNRIKTKIGSIKNCEVGCVITNFSVLVAKLSIKFLRWSRQNSFFLHQRN